MPGNKFFIFKSFPDVDTVKRVYIDTVKKVIEDPTINALYDSRTFYEDSMNKVLAFLGIAATIFIGLFAWKVFWDVSGSKKYSQSLLDGIKKKIKDIDERTNETKDVIEEQKNSIKKAFVTPCLKAGENVFEANGKQPSSESFSQYISALYYILILKPAESDLGLIKDVLEGIGNNWRAVGAIGKHPVIDPLEKLIDEIDKSEWNSKSDKQGVLDYAHRLLDDVVEGGSNVFVTTMNNRLVPNDESETEDEEGGEG